MNNKKILGWEMFGILFIFLQDFFMPIQFSQGLKALQ